MIKYHYLIAFGSNLGDKVENAKWTMELLKLLGCLVSQSSHKETAPLNSPNFETSTHEQYLNFVFHIVSTLAPHKFHLSLVEIENKVGHKREAKWLPRQCDLDILFCGVGEQNLPFGKTTPVSVSHPALTAPHPGFFHREFLLFAVEELAISLADLRRHSGKAEKLYERSI